MVRQRRLRSPQSQKGPAGRNQVDLDPIQKRYHQQRDRSGAEVHQVLRF